VKLGQETHQQDYPTLFSRKESFGESKNVFAAALPV
jgi:hypothetical protein